MSKEQRAWASLHALYHALVLASQHAEEALPRLWPEKSGDEINALSQELIRMRGLVVCVKARLELEVKK